MNKPKRSKYAPRATASGFKDPVLKGVPGSRKYEDRKPFESVTLKAIEAKMAEIDKGKK
jgi:hypothetical protein